MPVRQNQAGARENWLESTLIAPRRHKSYGKQTQGGPPQRDVRLSFKTIHGEQAGKRDSGGSAVGARHIVREHDTTQPVLNKDIKRAQVVCPWSPSQEGARGQGSSACRGTPSRREARALHHQPVPALTLTMPCLSCPSSVKILFHNGELNLFLQDSGCPLQEGTGKGLPGRAPGRC